MHVGLDLNPAIQSRICPEVIKIWLSFLFKATKMADEIDESKQAL